MRRPCVHYLYHQIKRSVGRATYSVLAFFGALMLNVDAYLGSIPSSKLYIKNGINFSFDDVSKCMYQSCTYVKLEVKSI